MGDNLQEQRRQYFNIWEVIWEFFYLGRTDTLVKGSTDKVPFVVLRPYPVTGHQPQISVKYPSGSANRPSV